MSTGLNFLVISLKQLELSSGEASSGYLTDLLPDTVMLLINALPDASVAALATGIVLALDAGIAVFPAASGSAEPRGSLAKQLVEKLNALRDRDRADKLIPAEQVSAIDADLKKPTARHQAGGLSKREFEVLEVMRSGLSNKAIAHKLNIAEGTVKIHVRNILEKTATSNRTQAAMWSEKAHRSS